GAFRLRDERQPVRLADVLAKGRLPLAGSATNQGERRRRTQEIGSCTAESVRRVRLQPAAAGGFVKTIGGDVYEQVHHLLAIYIGLTELDTLVVLPLCSGDLTDEISVRLVLAGSDLLSDEVPDEVPPRQHVGVGPLGLGRRVVYPRIECLAPDHGHLVEAEV